MPPKPSSFVAAIPKNRGPPRPPMFNPPSPAKPAVKPTSKSIPPAPRPSIRTPRASPPPPPPRSPPPPPPDENIPPQFRNVRGIRLFLKIFWYSIPKAVKWGVVASAGFLLIRDNMFSLDTVRGSSMAPSLSAEEHETGKRDWVWIRRLVPTADLRRGDIVTFWKPHRPGEISIKRVIGLEGDIVFPSRGYAVVPRGERGKMLGLMDGLVEGGEEGAVVVPHNHVWVEGDNWRKSYDSNDIGPISMTLIDGKATKVWKGWGWKDIPDGRTEKRTRVVETKQESALPDVFAE